jgi:hypothetical protein
LLPEGVVAEIKVAAFKQWPRDVVCRQPCGKALGLEATAFKHAIGGVNLGNEMALDVRPMAAEEFERVDVDRRSDMLHRRGGGHVAAPKQCPRQIEFGQDGRQQALECLNVALAIVEDGDALILAPGPAAQDQRPHLFVGADAVEAEIRERAE